MRDAEIVLLMPPSECVENDRLEPPLGLLYIAAVLRAGGHEDIRVWDMSGCRDAAEVESALRQIPRADIYGLTIFCSNHTYAKECVRAIRAATPGAYIVAGGPNPTALPEVSLRDLGVDAAVTGEGEDAVAMLVEQFLSSSPVKGVVQGVGRDDIDSYPFPARDLVDMSSYPKSLLGEPCAVMLSSRGCRNNCLHCNSNVMGGGNPKPRYRSAENIRMELEELQRRSLHHVRFVDDNFTANPGVESVLKALAGHNIRFRIHARVEALDEKMCRLLQEAGCVHVTVGLESLNPDNLRALGKMRQIGAQGNVAIAKRHGLTVRSSFMVGLPYDNDENIERYSQIAAELPFDEFEVVPLIPFPGTRIRQSLQQWGYELVNDDFTSYVLIGKNRKTTFALKHRDFSVEDIMRWRLYVEETFRASGKRFMRDSPVAR